MFDEDRTALETFLDKFNAEPANDVEGFLEALKTLPKTPVLNPDLICYAMTDRSVHHLRTNTEPRIGTLRDMEAEYAKHLDDVFESLALMRKLGWRIQKFYNYRTAVKKLYEAVFPEAVVKTEEFQERLQNLIATATSLMDVPEHMRKQ